MRGLFLLWLMAAPVALAAPAAPADVAREAHLKQSQGDYVAFVALIDPRAVRRTAQSVVRKLKAESPFDEQERQWVSATFGSSSIEELENLPAQDLLGRAFKAVFTQSLSPAELALVETSTFSLSGEPRVRSRRAEVSYTVTFSNGETSSVIDKRMPMVLVNGSWFIDGAALKAIEAALRL